MCCCGRDGTGWFAQLRLLLWKNWLLKKSRWSATCCELLFPVGAIMVLIMIRALVHIDDVPTTIPVQDHKTASSDVYTFVGDLACGRMGGTTRFPFQAIGIAPILPNQDMAPLYSLGSQIMQQFTQVAQFNNYTVPCCQIPIPPYYNTSVPGCYMSPEELKPYIESQAPIMYFNSSADMDAYLQTSDYGWVDDVQTLGIGLILDTSQAKQGVYSYTIRSNSSDVPWTGQSTNTLTVGYTPSDYWIYYNHHVLTLQWSTDQWIISQVEKQKHASQSNGGDQKRYAFDPHIDAETESMTFQFPFHDTSFVPFPVPAHKQDNFKADVGQVFGLFLVIAFMWPFSRMVRALVEEKEKRLSEGMKMMGLRNSVFWMSWVITYLITFAICCGLVIGISRPTLFQYSDSFILFIYFFFFSLSLISLACLAATFFSRAKTAGTLSPFLLLAGYLPYFSVADPNKDEGMKNLSCLLSPVAFSLGSTNILSFEGVFIGSQWNNSQQLIDNFRLGTCLGMLFFDAVLYGVLAWYLDKVWPREFGTRYPWYFLVTPAYWKACLCSKKIIKNGQVKNDVYGQELPISPSQSISGISISSGSPVRTPSNVISSNYNANYTTPLLGDEDVNDDIDFGHDYEPVPESMRSLIGVKIRGLRKEFGGARTGQPVVAVNNLDLNLYQGQCFVLLGHNGAGKTTTINMLTGLINTSSGHANIFGYSVEHDMASIRQIMGICPQHDVLFDDLTVYEHLQFFGRLKGISNNDLYNQVMASVEEVQLQPKLLSKASELSGGQRRRLSLAIALIGDSKVVFLDEPTSGVDPFSRRAIWDLITKKKESRVIVLTTHFMDEADQLGDRIGIMHHGAMKCCGTSLFLKRKFGVGYCMTLTKQPKCQTNAISAIVKQYVPEAALLSDVGSELSYSLPFSASSSFPILLSTFDSQMDSLGLDNYGLSVTTLEEVFIKVAEESHTDAETKAKEKLRLEANKHNHQEHSIEQQKEHQDALAADQNHSSWFRHFSALMKKRFHIQKRDKKALCCQILVPLILLALGLGLLRIPPDFDFPSYACNTQQFNQPLYVPYNGGIDRAVINNIDQPKDAILEDLLPNDDGTTQYSLYNYSLAILNNRTDHQQSRYGALFGTSRTSLEYNESTWQYTILNNASAPHGLPTFANLASTSFLRNITNNTNAAINVIIHPFSWTHRQKEVIQSINGIFAAIVIALAFAFVPASFAVFVVSEREFKSKHIQLISGVSTSSYWVANYLWDFISFMIPAVLAAFIIYMYNNPDLVENFAVLCAAFFLYGTSVIPFTYVCSFLFTSHSTAQNVMIMVYIFGGIILTMTAFALYMIDSTRDISTTYLRHVFRIIPSFCLGDTIFYLSLLPYMEGHGKWDLIISGYDLIYMLVESIVYFILALVIEKLSSMPDFMGYFRREPAIIPEQHTEPEDIDIQAERERLMHTRVDGDIFEGALTHGFDADREGQQAQGNFDLIRLEGLTKCYPKKTAARDIWFGVPAGQCFGFLGVNGAGKTTTLKILTGDVIPSFGRAFLGGMNIARYPAQVRRIMGYCPQFDALHENLTARETLEFYGRIRGIEESRLDTMVDYLIDRLSLSEYANRPAGTYSGGNKRKLSVAIALIGNPPIVFLDEPSTGMDPVSRRFMWDFISQTMTSRAVILTTHSMEECEALCSRIGILVNGAMKCMGSSQHLKHRFGRGFQVDISTSSNDPQRARDFILHEFKGAEEIECYGGKLKYKISPVAGKEIKLKDIFELIEQKKDSLGISEYSVGQTTLEQIFIQFAKKGDHEEFSHHGSIFPSHHTLEMNEEQSIAAHNAAQRAQSIPGAGQTFSFRPRGNQPMTPSSYGYLPVESKSNF